MLFRCRFEVWAPLSDCYWCCGVIGWGCCDKVGDKVFWGVSLFTLDIVSSDPCSVVVSARAAFYIESNTVSAVFEAALNKCVLCVVLLCFDDIPAKGFECFCYLMIFAKIKRKRCRKFAPLLERILWRDLGPLRKDRIRCCYVVVVFVVVGCCCGCCNVSLTSP